MKLFWKNGAFVDTFYHQEDGKAQGLRDQFGPPDHVIYPFSVCPSCLRPHYSEGDVVGEDEERFTCATCGATYHDRLDEEQDCADALP